MASFYARHILPRLITCACSAEPMRRQRESLVPYAKGSVLELGVGGGLNLQHYDPARVESLVGVDPSAELRALAARAPRTPGLSVEIRDGAAENLPFEDATFDCVVCTFTLCSVAAPARALAEVRRVLRQGGVFLFCEHGLAPDTPVRAWQRRIEPAWKRIAGGCHLTRPVGRSIMEAGFELSEHVAAYLPGAMRAFGWVERGLARARG